MSSLKEACSPPTGVSVGMPEGREGSVCTESLRFAFLWRLCSRLQGGAERGVRMGGIRNVLSWPH